ncbi:MAG: flippase [Patescibacteria group bacterium]
MNIAKTTAKNVFFLSLSDIISKVIGLFYLVIIARYLGAGNYGILMFASAFVEICNIALDLGLSVILIREVAKDEGKMNTYVNNIISLKIILAICTAIVVGIILSFTGYGRDMNVIITIMLITTVIGSITSIFSSIFQAFNKMQFVAIGKILATLLTFAGGLLLVKIQGSVIGFSYLYLLTSMTLFAISVFFYRTYMKGRIALYFDTKFWKDILRLALPFTLSIIFVVVYYRVGSIMLKMYRSYEEVGYYNAAYNFIFSINFIPTIIISAIFPIMSKLYVESRELLLSMFRYSFKFLVMIAIPLGVGTTLVADKIITLIYGPDFTSAILCLKILIWSLVIMFLNITFSNLLNVVNRQKVVAYTTFFTVLFNVAANFYAIPKYGITGASVANVLSEFLVLVIIFAVTNRINYRLDLQSVSIFFKVVVCSLLMGLFMIFFHTFNVFLLVALSIILYTALIIMFRVVKYPDLVFLKNSIFRKDKNAYNGDTAT